MKTRLLLLSLMGCAACDPTPYPIKSAPPTMRFELQRKEDIDGFGLTVTVVKDRQTGLCFLIVTSSSGPAVTSIQCDAGEKR